MVESPGTSATRTKRRPCRPSSLEEGGLLNVSETPGLAIRKQAEGIAMQTSFGRVNVMIHLDHPDL